MIYTEPSFVVETVDAIFNRNRPNLPKDFLLFVKQQNVKKGSIIRVTGKSGSGKTMFIMEIMARALLLSNGEKPEVLFVNIEKDFNILKFVELSTKLIKPDQDNPDHEHCVVKENLNRLHILTCSRLFIENIIERIEQALTENSKISLIVIDSLGFDYYADTLKADQDNRIEQSKDAYIASCLDKLSNLTRKFDVTLVFTKPEHVRGRHNNRDISTHQIELLRQNGLMYSMKITSDEGQELLPYSIDFFGINFTSET